ncbi:MAG: ABC transporter permease [Spirochaetes bacterium]|nr:ABC transporter permease [Spirochaetota bacterium]
MKLYEFFIGFRYLKSKKTQGFISFNTFLSVFIVFLGVFILIIVISVMNGFQSQIKDKILDVDSHITISRNVFSSEFDGIKDYNEIAEKVRKIEGVVSANPFFQGQGLLRFKNTVNPVLIRGIGSENQIPDDVKKFIDSHKYPVEFSGKKEVYIGEEMGLLYNVQIGDFIEMIVPKGTNVNRMDVEPSIGRFKVIGFFKTGYYEFDTRLIIMSLEQTQKLFGVGKYASGVGIKVNDIYRLDRYYSIIQEELGFDYNVYTAEQKNQNLFYALKLEKLIMTIILFLVIISASFTIMGTLVMVVMEKRKAVGILKAIGAGPSSIMAIFILEGFFIGLIGTVTGVLTGLVTALNLETIIYSVESFINGAMFYIFDKFNLGIWMDIVIVPKNVYYIDTIPTEIQPEFVVFIAAAALFISTVSAVFPAWYASRLNPVQSIRYE